MPSIPSPNALGHRQIVFDLNDASAFASPTFPSPPSQFQIGHVYVSGVAQTGDGTITIRTDSASGPIVWRLEANVAANTRFVVDVPFDPECAPVCRGLYIDALDAWTAGSVLIVYKR